MGDECFSLPVEGPQPVDAAFERSGGLGVDGMSSVLFGLAHLVVRSDRVPLCRDSVAAARLSLRIRHAQLFLDQQNESGHVREP